MIYGMFATLLLFILLPNATNPYSGIKTTFEGLIPKIILMNFINSIAFVIIDIIFIVYNKLANMKLLLKFFI